MLNAERAFSRDQIVERGWPDRGDVEPRTVDVHIRRLRMVLEEFRLDHLVQTVRGIGYRF